MRVEARSDYSPLQASLTAPEGRNCQRFDAPLRNLLLEIDQTVLDVAKTRGRAPVPLRREIDDPRRKKRLVQVRPPQLDFGGFAPTDVVAEHVREALAEPKGHAFAHDSNRVDRVHEALGLGLEEVAGAN